MTGSDYSDTVHTGEGTAVSAAKTEWNIKHQMLSELLEWVYQICAEQSLQYFAIGRLLSFVLEGRDEYPETWEYAIVMMREDYDRFFSAARMKENELGIQALPFYDGQGRAANVHSCLCMTRTEDTWTGRETRTLRLRIEPYEYLSSDEKERKAFQDSTARRHRRYRAASLDNLRKKGIAGAVLQKGREEHDAEAFARWNRLYRDSLTRYAGLKEPEYAGRIEMMIYPEHRLCDMFPAAETDFLGTKIFLPAKPREFARGSLQELEAGAEEELKVMLRLVDEVCREQGLGYVMMGRLARLCASSPEKEETAIEADIEAELEGSGQTEESADEAGAENEAVSGAGGEGSGADEAPDGKTQKNLVWRIGLLRKDYEKLLAVLERERPQGVTVCRQVQWYPLIHAENVCLMVRDGEPRVPGDKPHGLWLHPLDSLPDDYTACQSFRKEMTEQAKSYTQVIEEEKGLRLSEKTAQETSRQIYERHQRRRQRYNAAEPESAKLFTVFGGGVQVYNRRELFPAQRRNLLGIPVSGPANPYLWHEDPDDEYTGYIARQREKLLEVIDRAAGDNGIAYFAIASLLAGAVLYQDFVPNSGSRAFDLGFLRKDYERFLQLMRARAAFFGVQLNEYRDNTRRLPKLKKTISFPGEEDTDVTIGLVPFDKVPEDPYALRTFVGEMEQQNTNFQALLHRFTWRSYNTAVRNPFTREVKKQLLSGKPNVFRLKETWDRTKVMGLREPLQEAARIDALAQTYNEDADIRTYARVFLGRSRSITEDELFPLRRVRFGQITISCPRCLAAWEPEHGFSFREKSEQEPSPATAILGAAGEEGAGAKINEHAAEIIGETQEKGRAFKEQVLSELISCVNTICDENGLRYFASGRLLSWALTGRDEYPEKNDYLIVMMREDYDRFFARIRERASNWHLTVRTMYDRKDRVAEVHSLIRIRREARTQDDYFNLTLTLRVDPYEILPSQKHVREEFQRQAALKMRAFRAASRAEIRAASLPDTVRKAGRYLLKPDEFHEWKLRCRAFLHRYAGIEEPEYAGRVELLVYPEHRMDEIFPLTRQAFLGTELLLPAESAAFTPGSREEEERQIRERRLCVIKSFDTLCRDAGAEYVAMRQLAEFCSHSGGMEEEVPLEDWRAGLLREDYEKVLSVLRSNPGRYSLALHEDVQWYPLIHAEAVGIAAAEEAVRNPGEKRQILWLHSLDAVPDDYEEAQEFLRQMAREVSAFNRLTDEEKGIRLPEKGREDSTFARFEELQEKRRQCNDAWPDSMKVFTVFEGKLKIYVRKALFPAQRRPFEDLTISMPANLYQWHEKKDDGMAEYVAGRREGLLKAIDEIAAENDIPYFAIANLLIGAVIYHDFVPGSDGAAYDLGFLREDYERFLAILRRDGEARGLSLNEFRDEKGRLPRIKKTVSLPGDEETPFTIGILPFDKVPEDVYLYHGFIDDMNEQNRKYRELLKYYTFRSEDTLLKNPFTREMRRQALAKRPEAGKLKESLVLSAEEVMRSPLQEAERIDALARSFNDDDRTQTYSRVSLGRSKAITADALFPLQRVKFRGIEINCPRDYSVWQPMLDDELQRQVHAIQRADLLLLRELDRLCSELKIGYFVCGGTMLGYMRHGGFIPWDDDVDVAMLREDYERFIRSAGELIREGFFLQTRQTDPHIPYLFSKIRLDGTEYVTEYNENRDFHKGICLDIFPFDFLPDVPDRCQGFIKEVSALSAKHNEIANHQYGEELDESAARNEQEKRYLREQKQRLEYYWSLDLADSQQAYLDAATRYNRDAKEAGRNIVASFVPTFTWIDLKDLLPYQRGLFEGIEVSVPKRPDVFLEMQYGDYMQLPPLHQQVAHRLIRWSTWEESWDDGKQTEESRDDEK